MSQQATSGSVLTPTESARTSIPGQRTAPAMAAPAAPDRIPTLGELIAEALYLVRRDAIPSSGFLVARHSGRAVHRHEVWQLGPFALLDDGWFGVLQQVDRDSADQSRWLARHERRCDAAHWTDFRWVDPESLEAGCGAPGIGLGLGAAGPTYCPGHDGFDPEHPSHVSLTELMRWGLRSLAVGTVR